MVKKPIKKRARVRKPNSFAKSVRKLPSQWDKVFAKAAKKPKVLNPKFKLKIGIPDGDKFFVHPETIPDGVALQWVSNHPEAVPSIDQALGSGWKLVKEQTAIRGLVLMWAPQELANAQRDANIARAKQQMQYQRDALGMDNPYSGEYARMTLVSDSFMASEPYQQIPSDTPPIDVEVTTKFRLDARFQEAASLLKITPEVYAQRRLTLYLRGELGGILLPMYGPDGYALELIETGNFNIQSRKS